MAQTIPLPPPRPAAPRPAPLSPTPNPEPHPQERGGGLSHDQFRVRMRICALEWARMQQTEKAGDLLWRDFSSICLRRG